MPALHCLLIRKQYHGERNVYDDHEIFSRSCADKIFKKRFVILQSKHLLAKLLLILSNYLEKSMDSYDAKKHKERDIFFFFTILRARVGKKISRD